MMNGNIAEDERIKRIEKFKRLIVGDVSQRMVYTTLRNHQYIVGENHIRDTTDKQLKIDFLLTVDEIYRIVDLKTSIDHSESVSIPKDSRYLKIDNKRRQSNLDGNCWFSFLFRDVPEFALVRSTKQFFDFTKAEGCWNIHDESIVVTYNQIKEFEKKPGVGYDVEWYRLKDDTTLGAFFDAHWKEYLSIANPVWNNFSNGDLDNLSEEIDRICTDKLTNIE